MKKRVLVGMSGGVDSSVTAAILLEKNYDVVGVTFKTYGENLEACRDAKSICNFLGIKHIILDFKDFFYEKVIKKFVSAYFCGNTPNPCVMCNENVKFGKLLDYAMDSGFDFIATGHYANVFYDKKIQRFLLKKSKSQKKDQSYFLYRLSQNQLSKILFPLGNFEKFETRNLAKKYGLFVSEKTDSQEICFIDNGKYFDFIKKNSNKICPAGYFVDENGEKLGRHNGVINYTIGQRRGIGIGFGKRVYVTKINVDKNEVVLGPETSLYRKSLIANDLNFIKFDNLECEMEVFAKIRSCSDFVKAKIFPMDNRVLVNFNIPQKSITPGQSVVFYDESGVVIGGGIISLDI